MKRFRFFLLTMALVFAAGAQAQVEMKTTTTTLPDWGVAGSENAHYYYIPDIQSYYDISGKQFVYMDNGKWVKSTTLPTAYKDYDLYKGYKVVLTDPKEPYADFDAMKVKYSKGYVGEPQKTVKIKKKANGKVKIKEK